MKLSQKRAVWAVKTSGPRFRAPDLGGGVGGVDVVHHAKFQLFLHISLFQWYKALLRLR